MLVEETISLQFLPHNMSEIHDSFVFFHPFEHLLPYTLVDWRSNFVFDQYVVKLEKLAEKPAMASCLQL